jgi:anti-sigma B factor antagonist
VALSLTNGAVDGVAVLAMDGRIVLEEEATALRENVKGLLAARTRNLILDLKNVTMIDSSGFGAFVAAHSSAKSVGASPLLCNLRSRFNELLQITKLYTVFEVSTTELEAVRAMARTASAG